MHFFAQGELHCDNTATYPLDKRLELWPKMKKADKKGVIKHLVVQSQLTPNHSSKHINFVKKRRPHYSIMGNLSPFRLQNKKFACQNQF